MAKYTVTHTCGHSETIGLFGPSKDREWRIAREQGQDCRECYHAKQSARAAEQAQGQGLPQLVGTPKQIAWAETIRQQRLSEIAAYRVEFETRAREANASPADIERGLERFDALARLVRANADARYWIDTRNHPVRLLMKQAGEQGGAR